MNPYLSVKVFVFFFIVNSTRAEENKDQLIDAVSGRPNWFMALHLGEIAVLEVSKMVDTKNSLEIISVSDNKRAKSVFSFYEVTVNSVVFVSKGMDLKSFDLRNKFTNKNVNFQFELAISDKFRVDKNFSGLLIVGYSDMIPTKSRYYLIDSIPNTYSEKVANLLSDFPDSRDVLKVSDDWWNIEKLK